MKIYKKAIVAALGLLASATTIQSVHAEPFNGPYAGIETSFESYPDDLDGGAATFVVGWDWRFSNDWVVGIEGRFGEPAATQTETTSTTANTQVAKIDLENQVGGAVRIGRVINDNWMVYGTVGKESFDVKAIRTVTPKPPCTNCNPIRSDFSFSEDVSTLGLGLEWAAAKNWAVRAGYTYADGDAYERNSISFGVAYRF